MIDILREWEKGPFVISTDRQRVDIDTVHEFLSTESYWAPGVAREVVERSVAGTPLVFGVYYSPSGRQVGMARIITDFATFAYLCDVFILPEYRGQGLSKWLMEVIWTMPELQGQRRWMLATADAHGLYSQFGFEPLPKPERWMWRPGTWDADTEGKKS
jgi:GNAT superfamily N-acetyltransferase